MRRSAGPTGQPARQLLPSWAAVTGEVFAANATGAAAVVATGADADGAGGGGDHAADSAGRAAQPASARATAKTVNR
ncbi:hypothetical protein GCM10009687_58210 [Asanoa iriomotensis]|uniref:Uncharacterized protein n=1 Tax=Asanoa iriomotensis TaxID=234613 RepID=A0ABQ4BU16_9ACTN|nr:hypothetical protein Air01nite_01110 [Asanoa iriomotensis]